MCPFLLKHGMSRDPRHSPNIPIGSYTVELSTVIPKANSKTKSEHTFSLVDVSNLRIHACMYAYLQMHVCSLRIQVVQPIPTRLEGKQSVLEPNEVQSLPSDTWATEVGDTHLPGVPTSANTLQVIASSPASRSERNTNRFPSISFQLPKVSIGIPGLTAAT